MSFSKAARETSSCKMGERTPEEEARRNARDVRRLSRISDEGRLAVKLAPPAPLSRWAAIALPRLDAVIEFVETLSRRILDVRLSAAMYPVLERNWRKSSPSSVHTSPSSRLVLAMLLFGTVAEGRGECLGGVGARRGCSKIGRRLFSDHRFLYPSSSMGTKSGFSARGFGEGVRIAAGTTTSSIGDILRNVLSSTVQSLTGLAGKLVCLAVSHEMRRSG